MTMPSPEELPQQQLTGIFTLLQLEKDIRHAEDSAEFGFVAVNETLRLLHYNRAVLWQLRGRTARIQAVSGADTPNQKAPYTLWMQKFCTFFSQQESTRTTPQTISSEQVPAELRSGWDQWVGGQGAWCPLLAANSTLLGGLWLVRDEPWQEAEIGLLEQLADAYGHAWHALRRSPWHRSRQTRMNGRLIPLLVAAALIGAMFFPIQLSVLAPAQIVPIKPLVVNAPMRGVIKQFFVLPNQPVKTGDLLFRFDDTELRNRLQVARKALAETETKLLRARQKSLFERRNSADGDILQARVAIRQAEVQYAAGELERVEVRATGNGIALFADVNDWLGQPVATGEKVLLVAEPDRKELEVWMPADNAINMEPGAEVRMFLNVDPTLDVRATLQRASYKAKVMPDGRLAFQVRAAFKQNLPQLRIGHMGTAKIYGKKTRLYYYLFRRPLGTVRRALGL